MIAQNKSANQIGDSLKNQFNSYIFPAPKCSYRIQKQINQKVNVNYQYFTQGNKEIPYVELSTIKSRQSKKCAIFFHGNGEDIGHIQYMLCPLVQKANLTIYGLEYPTYGLYKKCECNLISDAIKYDSLLFYDFLIHDDRSYKDITVIGRSIGSGPATYLAGHKPQSALILISPFDNLKNWTKKYGQWGQIVKQHFNNEEQIKKFNGKFMVIHGQKDNLIQIDHSINLVNIYQAYNSQKINAVKFYPSFMSHNNFDLEEDIVNPVKNFLEEIHFIENKQQEK